MEAGRSAGRSTRPARSVPKYRRFAEAVRRRIQSGALPVGAELPTIEAMCRRHGISLVTAHRGIRLLSDEGLVSTSRRLKRITVVRECAPQPISRTTLVMLARHLRPRNDADNFILDMIDGARTELSRSAFRAIMHYLDETDYERRVTELAERGAVAGALLDSDTPLPVIERLARTGVPVIVMNRCEAVGGVSWVTPDFERAVGETARMMAGRGYERIAAYMVALEEEEIARRGESGTYYRRIARAFLEGAAAAGFTGDRVVIIPMPATPKAAETPETYGLPRRRRAGWRRTGIIARDDCVGMPLLAAIQRTGLELVRDVGVVSGLELDCGRASARPPSTWRVSAAEEGARAVRELLARIADPSRPAVATVLPMEFVDHGSV